MGEGVRRVLIVGAPRCGNRLLHRACKASPHIHARFDNTHGRRPRHTADYDLVLRVTRQDWARRRSMEAHPAFRSDTTSEFDELVDRHYPDVESVAYEDMVADMPAVIGRIAHRLGVPEWPCPEPVFNGNTEPRGL